MCPNMDELQKHYAKRKKSDFKDYILCDSISMKCPENTFRDIKHITHCLELGVGAKINVNFLLVAQS